jgi:hypothetical protein
VEVAFHMPPLIFLTARKTVVAYTTIHGENLNERNVSARRLSVAIEILFAKHY